MYEFKIDYNDGTTQYIYAEYYKLDMKSETYVFYKGEIEVKTIPSNNVVSVTRIWPEE